MGAMTAQSRRSRVVRVWVVRVRALTRANAEQKMRTIEQSSRSATDGVAAHYGDVTGVAARPVRTRTRNSRALAVAVARRADPDGARPSGDAGIHDHGHDSSRAGFTRRARERPATTDTVHRGKRKHDMGSAATARGVRVRTQSAVGVFSGRRAGPAGDTRPGAGRTAWSAGGRAAAIGGRVARRDPYAGRCGGGGVLRCLPLSLAGGWRKRRRFGTIKRRAKPAHLRRSGLA